MGKWYLFAHGEEKTPLPVSGNNGFAHGEAQMAEGGAHSAMARVKTLTRREGAEERRVSIREEMVEPVVTTSSTIRIWG